MIARVTNRVSLVAIAAATVILLAGCGSAPTKPAASATKKIYHWQMTLNFPLSNAFATYFKDFAARVKQDTHGQILITLYPPGELPYAQTQYVQAVGAGSIQMADASAPFISNSPYAQIPNLPMLINTPQDFTKAQAILGPYIQKDMAQLGVHLLYTYTFPVQNLWGVGSPVHSLADLKGMKIRASNAQEAQLFTDFGAEPVSLTTSEVAQAMADGTVSATATAGFIAATGVQGNITWGYLLNINMTPSYIIINKQLYDSLPSTLKAELNQASQAEQQAMLEGLPIKQENQAEAQMTAKGVVIVKASAADEQTAINFAKPMWTQYGQQNGPAVAAVLQKVEKALGK